MEMARISLELDCRGSDQCHDLSAPLLEQLFVGYEVCSVLEIPEAIGLWSSDHKTARKRALRATRRGYKAGSLQRERFTDELHSINVSTKMRQGRPMTPAYQERQTYGALPDFACPRHAIRTTGVWHPDGKLVAYLAMYRCGDLALVSQILGHADYLEDEMMFLLFQHALERESAAGSGFCVYNRHDSGTDGLRFFKERLGFAAREVAWLP